MEPRHDPLEELIAKAAPRAPRDFAVAVEARMAARRHGRRRTATLGALAAAAALVVWVLARPTAPSARASAWVATEARATTPAIAVNKPLAVGATVRVGDGGALTLERATALGTARARVDADAEVRVGDGALELLSGSVQLEGPEARLTGDVAAVTTSAVDAVVAVELRRNPMMKAFPKAAALTALLTVGVREGAAKVQPPGHEPVLLAKNDRTMVAPHLPPLTTRAATAKPAAATPAAATPAAAKPAPAKPAATTNADDPPTSYKDQFRASIQSVLSDIAGCYEVALEDHPNLEGRSVFEMKVVTEHGKGRIADAEVVPNEGDLNAPALQQCILLVLSKTDFPPSTDGKPVTVRYPLLLQHQR
jgi:hypothetical protein